MKKNDAIENLFESLKNELDVATPSKAHETLFLQKLQEQKTIKTITPSHIQKTSWSKWISSAATITLLIGIFSYIISYESPTHADLASVSPELEKTQYFFTNLITKQLHSLETSTTPDNKKLVTDALKALEVLEINYEKLKTDLVTSGNDKRVISAMIRNFQKRITLLENVLKNAQEINKLKVRHYEKQNI